MREWIFWEGDFVNAPWMIPINAHQVEAYTYVNTILFDDCCWKAINTEKYLLMIRWIATNEYESRSRSLSECSKIFHDSKHLSKTKQSYNFCSHSGGVQLFSTMIVNIFDSVL